MGRGFNRITDFIGLTDNKKYETLIKVGEFCKSKMDEYAAVDTGFMRSRNNYEVTKYFNQKLRLINDCPYAGFVEYGTYKMRAQPFIRPAIYNHISEINAIARGVWNGL